LEDERRSRRRSIGPKEPERRAVVGVIERAAVAAARLRRVRRPPAAGRSRPADDGPADDGRTYGREISSLARRSPRRAACAGGGGGAARGGAAAAGRRRRRRRQAGGAVGNAVNGVRARARSGEGLARRDGRQRVAAREWRRRLRLRWPRGDSDVPLVEGGIPR